MDLTVEFVTQTCLYKDCGITWGMTKTFNDARRRDHQTWYCPNGHSQYYPAQSDLELLRSELKQTTEKLCNLRICAETKKRRIASLKGVITKMKRRNKNA